MSLRIVHRINYSTQTAAVADGCYAVPVKDAGKPSVGFPVEVLIVECNPHDIDGEDVPLEIEGDAACILHALETACEMIRTFGDAYVKEGKLDPDWRQRAERERERYQEAAEAARKKGGSR